MKVERAQNTPLGKTRKTNRGGGGDFSLEGLGESEQSTPTRSAQATQAVGSVDALLSLQEVPDSTTGRAKAMGRASSMLDLMDEIRIGLLSGRLPKSRLEQLVRVVETQRDRLQDPRLETVLDEIELRARVELAKYQRYL